MRRGRATALAGLVTVSALAACSESAPDGGAQANPQNPIENECADATVVECVPDGTTLHQAGFVPDRAAEATGEPIRVGSINQDTGPAGAFPEITRATQAGVDFVNTELNGVDGRPLELITCDPQFSPAGSQQCAQQMVQEGVVAVVGGIDVFGDGIQILEDNGIPFVGGIPVSFASAQSPISFQFSGGSWGAFLGFADYAINELDVDEVGIMFGDFGPIRDAAEYGQRTLEAAGVEVKMVPFPVVTDDYLTPLSAAAEGDPDAIFVGGADTACVPSLQGALELELQAQLFLVGACLSPNILESAGDEAVEGRIFNAEQENTSREPPPDFEMYVRAAQKHGVDLDPAGAGVISFKSLMNLYAQMREAGGDAVTPDVLVEGFRSARDEPGFNGHRYTCDGHQIPELPALCSPQQTLARIEDGELVLITDWIDVSKLVTD